MANFQVELPDGRKFTVEGAASAQAAAEGIQQMLAQQSGQQQTQAPQPQQQDERSFPRAIADVGASFVGAIPKAAGAFVGLGSLSPITSPVADPISQGLMKAGAATDEMLLSDTQKQKNAAVSAALADAVRELGSDAEWTEKLAYVMEQGGVAAQTIKEDPSQIAMLTSQALPYMVGGGAIGRLAKATGLIKNPATAAAVGEGSIAAGAVAADIVAQLEAKGIEGYTPERLAALPAGAVTALIGRLGAKVNTKLGTTDIDTALVNGVSGGTVRGLSPKGAITGGGVEMGEEFLQSAQEQAFTNVGADEPVYEGVGPAAVQGAAAGFGMGSVIGSNVFNRDGSPRNPTDLQISQRAAAGDVARSLRKTAEDNEYNLGDIDPTSGYGAKQALEDYRRTQVTGIVNLVKSLKSQLDPKQAQTLEQLLQDYVPAEAGITASKRKVSAKVTTDQFDSVKRLVAGTQEGDTLLQELQKSNIVTDLFKDGMKGGVSKFTDLFNPLMTGGQSYDPTRVGNVVVGGLPLLSTGGASLIPQASIVLGGQAIDKVLGGKGGTRRKSVERFIKLNEGNDGLGRPTGPSLIAQAQQAARQEEQEAESSAALKEAVRRFRSERGGPEPDSAPLGMLYMGTGLDRSGLEQLLPHLEQHYGDRPEVTELIDQTRRNLAGDNNQITGLTDWISILNSVLSSDATIDGLRIADPDGSDARNQRRTAGFGPSAAQSSAGTSQQQQPQGRSPAVQQGIDDNRAQLEKLRQGLAANTSLTPAERGRLLTALDTLEYNLGSDPAVAAMDVVSRLKSDGISESLLNRHIMPYVDRVLRQQSRSGRRQQPPTSTGTDLAFDEDFDVGSVNYEFNDGSPIPVNNDGTITVYHRTNVDLGTIKKNGGFVSKENTDEVYVSTKINGQNKGYGKNVIQLKIDQADLKLDDLFDDEAHFRVSINKANKALNTSAASQPALTDNTTDLALDQDIAGQSAGALTQQPAQQPQPQSPFNMKSLVNKMLGSQPATPDQVKAQLPELRAVFEIGKKGTKYENGIQDIDTALALAKALNITVKMFDDQKAMITDFGKSNNEMVRGAFTRGQSNQEGTVWGLNPNAVAPKLGVITDLNSLTTLLHEIGHGIATGPSGFGFTNEIDAKGYNDLTGQRPLYNSRSFESALMPYLETEGAKNKSAIVKELINLQDKVKVYLENNPKEKREIRTLASAIEYFEQEKKSHLELFGTKDHFMQQMFKDHQKKLDNHRTYIRSLKEIAVDPVWVYLANPKLAKKVMPLTAKVLQEQFRNAQNPRIQFFSHPFAVSLAVVLAMMLNGRAEEEEEEQMRQQMPAGALSPQAGALSPQQAA